MEPPKVSIARSNGNIREPCVGSDDVNMHIDRGSAIPGFLNPLEAKQDCK